MRVDRTSGTRSGILDILSSRRQALKGAAGATALAFPLIRTSRAAAQDATTVTWFAGRDTSGYTPTQVEAFNAESDPAKRAKLYEDVQKVIYDEAPIYKVGDFNAPDETRTPDKTTIEIVRMGGSTASRMRLEPGWRWSACIKPIVGGERCQALNLGLLQSGTMHVVHDDGTEQEIGPGQSYVIEPGHDAWVVGDEPVVGFEFQSRTAEEFARG